MAHSPGKFTSIEKCHIRKTLSPSPGKGGKKRGKEDAHSRPWRAAEEGNKILLS